MRSIGIHIVCVASAVPLAALLRCVLLVGVGVVGYVAVCGVAVAAVVFFVSLVSTRSEDSGNGRDVGQVVISTALLRVVGILVRDPARLVVSIVVVVVVVTMIDLVVGIGMGISVGGCFKNVGLIRGRVVCHAGARVEMGQE